MTVLSLPKNYLLLEAPKISEHAYYLDEGFALSYSFYNGTKVTENFWKGGEIMASFESFLEQKPSLENIQLMQKSEVFCISYDSVMHLLKMFHEGRHVQQILLSRLYARYRTRTHDMERLSAHLRFEKLLGTYPNLEGIVSQHAIATYLGITAQSMARMKRNED